MDYNDKLKKFIKENNKAKIDDLFEEIYYSYRKLVSFIIAKYVNNHMDVEDLTSDVFINFYKKIHVSEINNIKYYLVTSAKNLAINYLNKKEIYIEFDDNFVYECEQYNGGLDKYYELIDYLKTLVSEFELEIILKHLVYDYTFKDLSTIYDKPLKSIYSIYSRAIKKIKKGVK